MNLEKILSFLGKENTASPERILSVIEEGKSSTSEEGSKAEDEEIKKLLDTPQEIETPAELSEEEKEEEEIEKFLSIFDAPLPTYNQVKELTIPDILKGSQQKAEAVETIPPAAPRAEDITELIKEFRVGRVEEEKEEEVSTSELEGLLGLKEEDTRFVEESIFPSGSDITSLGKEELYKEEEPGKPFGEEIGRERTTFEFPEEDRSFSFGEIGEKEEKFAPEVEEIVKGIEQAEEVEFEKPLEEFYEEHVREEVETRFGKEKLAEIPFEEATVVRPEDRIYRPAEAAEKTPPISIEEPKPRKKEIPDTDIIRAISMLKNYSSPIRKAVKELIEKGILSETQINNLFSKILENPSEEELKGYISTIAPFYRFEEGRRIIIAAKKSKTEEALEKVLKSSVIIALGAGIIGVVGFIVFTIVSRNIYSENLYNRGLKMIDAGHYEEAENLFRRAEEVGGRKKEWYTKYAIRYLYNNVPERAVKKLEDGLKIWNYDYRLSLNYIEALTKLPQPDFDKALRYSEEFRRVENNSFRGIDLNAQVYIKMGDHYKSKDYYKEAEVLYMKYLKSKDNKHIPSLFRLISIYIKLDKKDRVDEIYNYIKRLNEKAVSEPVGIELARYYIDKNDLEGAKRVLFELSTIKPENPEFYYEFARYLFKNENYREATKNLNTALKLNPKHAKSYVLLGDINYLLRNTTSAIENYQRAIEIDPLQNNAHFRLGDIFYENKEYTTALGYYLEGLKIGEPEDLEYLSHVYFNIAKIYYYNNMLNESLKYLSRSYIKSPQNPLLSHFMGNIYLELGKPDMALVQYNKSIEGYLKIMEKVKVIDPRITRHRELVSFLVRTYNNQGVAHILLKGDDNIKNAMLSWWEAKNYAEKINSVYPNAEYNLKLVLHPTMIKYRNFAVDREIPDTVPKYVYTYLKE